MKLWKNQSFTIAHADSGTFKGAGLRPFFAYRDLGINQATKSTHGAHVIRVLQPPGTEHREVRHSDDMELVEVISPAEFPTQEEDAP